MAEERTAADRPPDSATVTDFDRQNLKAYLRILDAASEGAHWRDVAAAVLHLDVGSDAEHARQIYDAFARRARWMSDNGFRHLLESGGA
jgi:hypothetical protein